MNRCVPVFAAALLVAHAHATAEPPATEAAKPAAAAQAAQDPTRTYRRPGELVARCGAVLIKDVGRVMTPEEEFEEKGPRYVNMPPGGSINRRGQAVVVTAAVLPEGVTREGDDGVVQLVIKGRPATGVINDRGDVLGQVIVDVVRNGKPALDTRAFFLSADVNEPEFIEVPPGMHLEATGLNELGVGCGNLIKSVSDPALEDRPVLIVADPATGKRTLKPLVERAKVPEGLTSWSGWQINESGDVGLGLQRPTGKMLSGAFKGKDGKVEVTCPIFIDTVSQCATVSKGEVALIPVPQGKASMSPCALTEDGTVVGMCTWWIGEARMMDAGAWRGGSYKAFKTFPESGVVLPCDAHGPLACGLMTLSDAAFKGIDPAAHGAIGDLRSSGVLWDLRTGGYITLDSLLAPGDRCTHITVARAIRADKVLCTGVIDGKPHAVVVTLPPLGKLAAAFSDPPKP